MKKIPKAAKERKNKIKLQKETQPIGQATTITVKINYPKKEDKKYTENLDGKTELMHRIQTQHVIFACLVTRFLKSRKRETFRYHSLV